MLQNGPRDGYSSPAPSADGSIGIVGQQSDTPSELHLFVRAVKFEGNVEALVAPALVALALNGVTVHVLRDE